MPNQKENFLFLKTTGLLIFIVIGFYLHITNGMFDMSLTEVLKTLIGLEDNEKFQLVIFELRLPRIIIAILVGIGLALAGCVLQGITKNDLADPGILGINAGAGAAVVFFMYFFQFQAIRTDGTEWLNIMTVSYTHLTLPTMAVV